VATSGFVHMIWGAPLVSTLIKLGGVKGLHAGSLRAWYPFGGDRQVLERKFSNSRWSIEAHDALRWAGLDPAESELFWIALSFK
jgi:hypothetical protein